MKSLVLGALTVCVALGCVCFAAPEPAIIQRSGEWTLSVTFTQPEQIVMRLGAAGRAQRFWYTILSVTNNTDEDVDFYPQCDMMTDAFQIIPAGRSVSPNVFEQIKIRHQNTYPFLEPLEHVGDRILQGEDNAKDIAIIWPDFDAQAKNVKFFITGLSNETAVVNHPVERDQAGQPIKVYLRKTLELSYDLTGEPAFRLGANVVYKGERWVMR